MDEIRAMAGPIVQRHFEKVEADRQRVEAEQAAKKAAEDEARKAAEAEKTEAEKTAGSNGADQEMKDAEAPQPETEEAGDPK